MSYSATHIIINPLSAGGSTRKNWKNIEEAIRKEIGDFSHTFTEGPADASRLAKEATDAGTKLVIVIGGDGTVSESVNGIMESEKRSDVILAMINHGTGGDFARTLGVPADLHLALDQIKRGRDVEIDVGRITFGPSNASKARHFINIAGCGMAGEVVKSISTSKKTFGAFSYYLTAFSKVLTYNNMPVSIQLDDGEIQSYRIVTIAVCNGQFFGGGMQVAPGAELADGLLDITVINNWNAAEKILYSRNLYNGTIQRVKGVETFKARKIVITPDRPNDSVLIDCDGEFVGSIPMTGEILPKALRFRI